MENVKTKLLDNGIRVIVKRMEGLLSGPQRATRRHGMPL